jgi:hypothetical protein
MTKVVTAMAIATLAGIATANAALADAMEIRLTLDGKASTASLVDSERREILFLCCR